MSILRVNIELSWAKVSQCKVWSLRKKGRDEEETHCDQASHREQHHMYA